LTLQESAKGSGVAFLLRNNEGYPITVGQRNIAFSDHISAMSSNQLELFACWWSIKEVSKICKDFIIVEGDSLTNH